MGDQGFLVQKPGFATTAIRAGHDPSYCTSEAVVTPIVTSTTFKQPAPGEYKRFKYGRSGNPTRNTLEQCLAALDGAKHALTFSSGLGATTTIASLLSQGDHIIASDDLYGGTDRLFRAVMTRLGIEVTFTDFTNMELVKSAFKKNTKLMWLETPTNPLLKVVDIAALSRLAKSHGDVIVVVDNTFLTSYLQRPLDFGADIIMYSLTKYMNGHSDVIMGAAVLNDDELNTRLRFLQNSLGIVPSPMDCYLVNRSLKTLALRMEQHKKSALTIAQWLEKHPKITEVLHPGLPTHPQHEIAKKQMTGHSGTFSFRHSGGLKESKIFLSSLQVFILAESLGGYESLAELPTLMTHASLSPERLELLGITDSLIRLSVGLEDIDDLIKDLDQALKLAFE
ncbi:cystathionine gamma-lyase-like [Leptidea sinapis]|uniref:cystathionine gamma-lyase-like n=1 Tax=Leptidea sinapis TaxID=189913 RepID=UPI0021355B09|nr:cystathionine gamma-lyase-like [Leptidea sinapis]XP_050666708.1 cystathionine gamma-lyase-like [Leptidea sinapis]XP_050666709.1 cystathionine gamma-lyase-like [Leptidea sinapis]